MESRSFSTDETAFFILGGPEKRQFRLVGKLPVVLNNVVMNDFFKRCGEVWHKTILS
jgi:hypothetical protein